MINSQRSGRHVAAPAVKPMTAGIVTAAAATAGLMFSSAVPAAVGTEEQIGASERIDLADQPIEAASQEFTVETDGAQEISLDEVTVTAEAPVIPEPVVEAPAPAAAAAPAQTATQQAAPAPAAAPAPSSTQTTT